MRSRCLPTPVVSVDELKALLQAGAERPTLLDVRWELGAGPGHDRYMEGHIPGAIFIDLEADLAAAPGPGGRHPLPAAEHFTASMRAAGVDMGRGVVVSDAGPSLSAARAWWLLRYFGHPSVAVLDGGFAAWRRAGLPVARASAAAPGPAPGVPAGDFEARPGSMAVLDADGAGALAAVGVLLDARAAERFRGESEPMDPVAGHIPGARNRPAALNVDESGRFLTRSALRRAFGELGVDDTVAVGAYCGSGVTAAHEVLALEIAGYEAALYPGSWSEWITDPARPVATCSYASYKKPA